MLCNWTPSAALRSAVFFSRCAPCTRPARSPCSFLRSSRIRATPRHAQRHLSCRLLPPRGAGRPASGLRSFFAGVQLPPSLVHKWPLCVRSASLHTLPLIRPPLRQAQGAGGRQHRITLSYGPSAKTPARSPHYRGLPLRSQARYAPAPSAASRPSPPFP